MPSLSTFSCTIGPRSMMSSMRCFLADLDSLLRSSSRICLREAVGSGLLDAFLETFLDFSSALYGGFDWQCLGHVCHITPQLHFQCLDMCLTLQPLHSILMERSCGLNLLCWAGCCIEQDGHVMMCMVVYKLHDENDVSGLISRMYRSQLCCKFLSPLCGLIWSSQPALPLRLSLIGSRPWVRSKKLFSLFALHCLESLTICLASCACTSMSMAILRESEACTPRDAYPN